MLAPGLALSKRTTTMDRIGVMMMLSEVVVVLSHVQNVKEERSVRRQLLTMVQYGILQLCFP